MIEENGDSDDISNVCMFTIKALSNSSAARSGLLHLAGRTRITTPHYLADTSRGAVPHISQDVFSSETGIKGVYLPIEDFIEKAPKQVPPVIAHKTKDGASRLRRYTALPDDSLLVLGARRAQPIKPPVANTSSSIPIFTSVGFTQLDILKYADYGLKLQPDIVIGIADIPFNVDFYSKKRTETMTDRSPHWMSAQIKKYAAAAAGSTTPALFAPVLPLPLEQQRWYLDELAAGAPETVKGLAIYETHNLSALPAELITLPRIALTRVQTPQALLRQIKLGIDVFTLPFIGTASDAGIALDFTFPGTPSKDGRPRPLGVNMWLEEHAADVSPLSKDCLCYACTNHHRAYMRHLLSAKEMLAWGLLQIHNHHIMDEFFAGVRDSIDRGTFDEDCMAFERTYEPSLPEQTGTGPRLRGYQYRSEGPGEVKRNKAAFNTLDDIAARAADLSANPINDVPDIAEKGFAEKL